MTSKEATPAPPVVELRGASKTYRQGELEVQALKPTDFTMFPRGFAALCGPSGSGKTTLLNLAGALDEPSSGTVRIDGERVDNLSASARSQIRLHKIGFIFQAYNLVPVLSARENVEFVMQLQGVPASERRERAQDVLNAVGLSGLENRRPAELSGGQQQRVAVARAIVSKPQLILADEPTANLDSKTAQSLLELMRGLNQLHNIAFLFSTHDQLVMEFAERVIRLQDGEIVSDESQ